MAVHGSHAFWCSARQVSKPYRLASAEHLAGSGRLVVPLSLQCPPAYYARWWEAPAYTVLLYVKEAQQAGQPWGRQFAASICVLSNILHCLQLSILSCASRTVQRFAAL